MAPWSRSKKFDKLNFRDLSNSCSSLHPPPLNSCLHSSCLNWAGQKEEKKNCLRHLVAIATSASAGTLLVYKTVMVNLLGLYLVSILKQCWAQLTPCTLLGNIRGGGHHAGHGVQEHLHLEHYQGNKAFSLRRCCVFVWRRRPVVSSTWVCLKTCWETCRRLLK